MSECDLGSRKWRLSEVDGITYWVEPAQEYVDEWFGERGYSLMMRVFFPQPAQMPKIVDRFHLQAWFAQYAQSLLAANTVARTGHGFSIQGEIRPSFWNHPADALTSHIARFKEQPEIVALTGLTPVDYTTAIEQIAQLKQARADAALANYRQRAIEITIGKLMADKDKTELLELAKQQQVEAKKSWSKEKISQAIVTQEFAEQFLKLESR